MDFGDLENSVYQKLDKLEEVFLTKKTNEKGLHILFSNALLLKIFC
jgi:hypothetical protein